MLDRAFEYQKMADVESALWWYRTLHANVIHAIERQFPGERAPAILDAGCGTGGTLARLRERWPDARLHGIDVSEHALAFTRSRGFDVEQSDVRDLARVVAGQRFDVITLNDVTCYIPLHEWPAILNSYLNVLTPRGVVVINAPSFEAFRGMHDLAVGILYRLRRSEIDRLYDPARFTRSETRCWPLFLSPLIWAMRLKQRRALTHDAGQEIRSDIDLPSPLMNEMLFRITAIERWVPAPIACWGSSLFFVLRQSR